MLNLILFGPPGSGKGTQATFLAERYDLVHISTGDLFRSEIKGETELGTLAKSYMNKGELVPDEVTIAMLRKKVESHPEASGFIFDGFPRTVAQAEALDTMLGEMKTQIEMLLSLSVDDEAIVQRILKRAETSGRADDADEGTIRNRINVYTENTTPVFDYYAEQERSSSIDGMGSIDDVTHRLFAALDAHCA